MGPVVDEKQLETDLRYLEVGDRRRPGNATAATA